MFQALGLSGPVANSRLSGCGKQGEIVEVGRSLAGWSDGPPSTVGDVVDPEVASENISSPGKLIFYVSKSLPSNSDSFSQLQCKAQSVSFREGKCLNLMIL